MAVNKNKPLVELDKPGGKPIAFWNSAKEAAEFYQFGNQVIISYNVKGLTKQAKGHYFRFATEKEIVFYEGILKTGDEKDKKAATPAGELDNTDQAPVETIPEKVTTNEGQQETLSPFELLLQNSKKKFNENSE